MKIMDDELREKLELIIERLDEVLEILREDEGGDTASQMKIAPPD
jgi:hypothetical protein